MPTNTNPPLSPDPTEFVITRVFGAPIDRVWNAWTESAGLTKWFGPKGAVVMATKQDFRPGGNFLFCLKPPGGGKEIWGKFVYREIIPQQRLVWIHSFSDEHGNLRRHPYVPDWPAELLTTVTFAEQSGKTTVTLHWSPIHPTDTERKTFAGNFDGMRAGWEGSFEVLDEYLAKA
ncbi:MAG TPA: SRPBCC domain-containing protein [Tepidisphaeraceae bacterium]|jgi:uncharacterized protein YndB with AHSA1/START domain|nr:SRPBCC domain-containing protein [Tepidisphaeraceae bacterium]